eukprot:Platyproteum_vivax@DN1129_c0_g1_i2.p1
MLWVDKYRPKTLDELTYHAETSQLLRKLVESGDFPHLLFYGPSGAGKKTRLNTFLREVYGKGAQKIKIDTRSLKTSTSSSATVDVHVVTSSFHLEVCPADVGNKDRIVVQQLIKEIAQSPPLQSTPSFKVVVINEADRLSREAQAALRRTMERYMNTCRLILCCTSLSRVLPPVRSRCLTIRIPAPTHQQVVNLLQDVASKQKIQLSDVFATKIAQYSRRDARKALLMLETAKVQKYPFSDNQAIPKAPWELYIEEIVKDILADQSPKKLLVIRGKLYDLLTSCIPGDITLATNASRCRTSLEPNLNV